MGKKFIYNDKTAIVETDRGRIRGYFYDGMFIFKGVPYAKARRFHAPEPVDAWEGVKETTSFGYVCPLMDMDRPNGELLVPHRYWVMNEDCQNLNIWTPGLDGKKRPVMVWLHGGGFFAGSAIEHIAYEGENMCKEGQVVVVSVNHRLNVLGYCDLSDFGEEYANSGNAGTDDLVAALKWIHDNIERFGGDPENVIIFGQSGGGAKVTTLLQTPAADGLFAKGIVMSGVIGPTLGDSNGSGEKLVKALMDELKISDVKALETVPYQQLADAYKKVSPALAAAGEYVGNTPHPNAFYLGDPLVCGFRPETAHIPLMVGSVFGEFTSFVPCPYNRNHMTVEEGCKVVEDAFGKEVAEQLVSLFQKAYPERNPVDLMLLDFIFRDPEIAYLKKRSALNDKTWSYFFNLDLAVDEGRTPWHCADIPYFFHNIEFAPYTQGDDISEHIEKLIFDSVMAFAKNGNPENPEVPSWPACTPDRESTLMINRETAVRENFDHELMPVFKKYMEPIFLKKRAEEDANIQH